MQVITGVKSVKAEHLRMPIVDPFDFAQDRFVIEIAASAQKRPPRNCKCYIIRGQNSVFYNTGFGSVLERSLSMRNNSSDETIKRNYIQKYRFLINEYELVKNKKVIRKTRYLQEVLGF